MTSKSIIAVAALAFVYNLPLIQAKGFLKGRNGGATRTSLDSGAFQSDLQNAMGEALGCGGHLNRNELSAIEKAVLPIWNALPKSSAGRIERRSLRYLAYRYFNQQSALLVRGFEPFRPVNQSDWGNADILSERVPGFVESALQSQHALENGFSLHDAVQMVATLEELLWDAEGTLLEQVYEEQRKPTTRSLSSTGLAQVLESYMLHWMLGGDAETLEALVKDEKLRGETIPHWNGVVNYVKGEVMKIQFQRYRNPTTNSRPDHNALAEKYSFEDAHQVVGGITKSFASYWDSECRSMTAALIEMDAHNTGRVPLSKFYGSALDAEWRFGESEAYLRELGALDETSSWRGKQVIIPNYIQGMNNCIVSAPHYLVCCVNYCESILGEIESTFSSPMAPPIEILALVGNMTSQPTLEHEDLPEIGGVLATQLEQIASAHAGNVPLHGRLFAQWLHYAFPRECPFPHKTGNVAASTPYEFGDKALASNAEMKSHSHLAEEDSRPRGKEEEQAWMSQWSSEEELIADYAGELRAPWESNLLKVVGAWAFLLCGLLGVGSFGLKTTSSSSNGASCLPTHGKAHFV